MSERRLLTIRELAAQTGVSGDMLRVAASKRAFPTVRLSQQGRYRARLSDVEAWLLTLQVPAVKAVRKALPATNTKEPFSLENYLPRSEWTDSLL